MKRVLSKNGLSPVIATVLLVSIALILAIIIFLWAKSFVAEKVQKFNEPVENACSRVKFNAEAVAGEKIYIENLGNVPMWGVEIRKKGAGTIENVKSFSEDDSVAGTISTGENGEVELPSGVSSGDEIIVVPVILGETTNLKKAHICDSKYGVETLVE